MRLLYVVIYEGQAYEVRQDRLTGTMWVVLVSDSEEWSKQEWAQRIDEHNGVAVIQACAKLRKRARGEAIG